MKRIYTVKNKKSLRENLRQVLPEMLDDVMRYKQVVVTHRLAKDVLHTMRIAGKPLRYAMEIAEYAFGEEFKKCLNEVKDTVEMMGDIHDADVMIPEIASQVSEIRMFNSTIPVYKEKISTSGLRKIIKELRQERKEKYELLSAKLNEWEKNDFRSRLVRAMEETAARRNDVSAQKKNVKSIAYGEKAKQKKKINNRPLGERSLQKQRLPNIIKSRLLGKFPDLVHGMSTKIGLVNEPPFYNNLSSKIGDKIENVNANRKHFLDSLGISEAQLAVPHQVHSNTIEIVDKPGFYDKRDGLITAVKNVFLVVSTADCLPVLIYDKAKQVCGAIHSGWRGTQQNIIGEALKIFLGKFESQPADLLVFIGPGISRKHFEVGEDVAALFDTKFVEDRNGKFYVNILGNVLEQIKSFGIKSAQIEYSRKCSFAEINYLHSYRRDREKSGRMFSVIGMKE
jgi:hypothetical protein